MLIDWFTVIAQIINFLVLLWFLKHYLYTPILKAIDEREKRIADQLKSAQDEKENAFNERKELERKNGEFDIQRSALFEEARVAAQSEKQKLLENVRTETEYLRTKLWNSLQNEYLSVTKDIYAKTQQEVFSIARKTLSDLADSELEECIARSFTRKILSLTNEDKKLLLSAIEASDNRIFIRSTFSIPYELQKQIETAITAVAENRNEVTFQDSQSRVLGIELIANNYKLEWNISEYLGSMEKTISGIIEEKAENKIGKGITKNAVGQPESNN